MMLGDRENRSLSDCRIVWLTLPPGYLAPSTASCLIVGPCLRGRDEGGGGSGGEGVGVDPGGRGEGGRKEKEKLEDSVPNSRSS